MSGHLSLVAFHVSPIQNFCTTDNRHAKYCMLKQYMPQCILCVRAFVRACVCTGADLGFSGANVDIYICAKKVDTTSVRSTLSMRSMLYLGGPGGMPPQQNFANLAY